MELSSWRFSDCLIYWLACFLSLRYFGPCFSCRKRLLSIRGLLSNSIIDRPPAPNINDQQTFIRPDGSATRRSGRKEVRLLSVCLVFSGV
ncbi:hypothetical protein DL95DRAFT_386775 [Leptodontidium sp. 2 PMI_412]|nr:hypothetical protein DL95DRAFT_386775 [Leptodontidium sp. 2 PMI_412]